jgi:hypothetical protein
VVAPEGGEEYRAQLGYKCLSCGAIEEVRMTKSQLRLFERNLARAADPAAAPEEPRTRRPKAWMPENVLEKQITDFLRYRGFITTRQHIGTFIPYRGLKQMQAGHLAPEQAARNIIRIGEEGATDWWSAKPIIPPGGRSLDSPWPWQAFWWEAKAPGRRHSEVAGVGLSSLDRLFRPKRYGQFAILDCFVDEGKMIWTLREAKSIQRRTKAMTSASRPRPSRCRVARFADQNYGGRREKLEAQKLDCGKARYGYINLDKYHPAPADRQTYALDPKEALPGLSKQQVVRDICAWCLAGMKTYSIAKRLNEMGVLSAGDKRHPPGRWSQRTVRKTADVENLHR